jgi:hypothetical protein
MTAVTDFSLSTAQSYNSDFLSGERSAFDISLISNTKYQLPVLIFDCMFNLKFAVGVRCEKSSKLESDNIIPTDNELFGESVIKYPIGWMLDPFFSTNMRTQLTEAMMIMANKKIVTGKFWDPVNSQQTLGLAFSIKDSAYKNDIRIGISLLQVRSELYNATADDPKTFKIRERYKSKAGIDLTNNLFYQIDKSTSLNSKISLFGDIDNLNVWIFRFENDINIMIWKIVGLICKLNFLYDQNQMTKLQVQQSLRIGLITKI